MRRAWLLMVASLLLSDRAISQTTGRPMPSISGIVVDSLVRHAALAGAEVVMVESGRSTATDANGRFRFDSAPPGPVRLTFYHAVLDSLGVGAAVVPLVVLDSGDATVTLTTPAASTVMRALCGTADPALGMVIGRVRDVDNRMIDVDLPTNGERTDTVTLARHAQTLAAVNVVAAGTIYDATGFEQRRATYPFGHYITAEEIKRRGDFDTHTLLPNTGPGRLRPSFGALTLSGGCAPVVFVDGNLVDPGTRYAVDAMDMIRPRDIRGMEIYGTADGAPFQFRDPRGRCGSVVIWTRPSLRKDERPK